MTVAELVKLIVESEPKERPDYGGAGTRQPTR